MRRYADVVINQLGVPQTGATVTVTVAANPAGSGALATIYSDDGVTTQFNPVSTDSNGRFSFYVADGRYDLKAQLNTGSNYIVADQDISTQIEASLIEQSFYVDGKQFAKTTAGLQAAINAAGSGGTVHIPANTTIPITGNVTITGQGTTILCDNATSSILSVQFAGDAFTISAANVFITNCTFIQANTTSRATSGAGGLPAAIIYAAAGGIQSTIQNFGVSGNNTTPNNGTFFRSTAAGISEWTFNQYEISPVGAWSNYFLITNGSQVTTSSGFSFNQGVVFSGGASPMTDACYAFDGMIDTVQMGIMSGSCNGQPMLVTRNTVGGPATGFPRWVHCDDCSFECNSAAQPVVLFTQGRDLKYGKYVATCQNGISIGAVADGVDIEQTVFANISQECVIVNNAATNVQIIGNYFNDCANGANNTKDVISAPTAGTIGLTIALNHFSSPNANKPRYAITTIGPAGNSLMILGNDFSGATFGTGYINNTITGANQTIFGNLPALGNGVEIISSQEKLTGLLTATANILVAGTGQVQFAGSSSGLTALQASATASGTLTLPAATGLMSASPNLLISTAAPTISTHFNTSGDSISNNNGTAAFTITVGTGAATNTGTIGLPNAANGWNCYASNRSRGAYIQQTGATVNSATLTNYGTTIGTPVNWTNSDVLTVSCFAF